VLAGDLFVVVVGHGGAVVDLAEAVDHAGVEQQRRDELRLAASPWPTTATLRMLAAS
jgi:hypothetical protein